MMFGFLSIGAHTVAVSALYVLMLCLFGWWVMYPPSRRKILIFLVAGAFISAVTAVSLAARVRDRGAAAFVIAAQAQARFEPLESATAHFTLHEGSRVEVLLSAGGWAKVRRSDGKIGWVESPAIEKVSGDYEKEKVKSKK